MRSKSQAKSINILDHAKTEDKREREREYTLLIKYVGKMEHSLSFCFVSKVKKLLHDASAPKKI